MQEIGKKHDIKENWNLKDIALVFVLWLTMDITACCDHCLACKYDESVFLIHHSLYHWQ